MADGATREMKEFDAARARQFILDQKKPDFIGLHAYLISLDITNQAAIDQFLIDNDLTEEYAEFREVNANPPADILELKEMLLSTPSEEWDVSKITPEALRQVGYLSKAAIRSFQIYAEEKGLYPDSGRFARDGIFGPRTAMAARLIQEDGAQIANELLNNAHAQDGFSSAERMHLQQAYNLLNPSETVQLNAHIQEPVATEIYDRIAGNTDALNNTTKAALALIDEPLSDTMMDALVRDNTTLQSRLENARIALKNAFANSTSPTLNVANAYTTDGAKMLINAANMLGVDDPRHVAYILATTLHETAHRMGPVREGLGATDEQSLAILSQYDWAQRYIQTDSYTGESYFGRGYVQITWAENYQKSGAAITSLANSNPQFAAFLQENGITNEELQMIKQDPQWLYKNPDYALNPALSAAITVIGMRDGSFTGKSLDDYFNTHGNNPRDARAIVNGDVAKNGSMIAGYYNQFLTLMKEDPERNPNINMASLHQGTDIIVPKVEPKDGLSEAAAAGRAAFDNAAAPPNQIVQNTRNPETTPALQT